MSDNLKMFLRYGAAIAVSFAVGRGWVTPDQGESLTKLVVETAGILIALAPAIYAAFKVNNTPKVS